MRSLLLICFAVWVVCEGKGCGSNEDLVSYPKQPRMSMEVVGGTSIDKQANAVRRQGVDSTLLRYAAMVLSNAPTGVIYNVGLPPSLNGIQAQAIFITLATDLTFNEFTVPHSASFIPSSTFVALVYRKISSFTVYTLPSQYQFGGPVVGIISSASNSTFIDPSLPQASITLPSSTFIDIALPMYSSNPTNANPLCAFFASNGSIYVGKLVASPNLCTSSTLGDFALVFQTSSSPIQTAPPPPPTDNIHAPAASPTGTESSKHWKLIIAVTCLALAGLALLIAIFVTMIKLAEYLKLFFTTRFTGDEEALQSSLIGGSRAPSTGVVRTKPGLEIDMAHFSS